LPAESPNHGGRALVTNPADAAASPFGWHDTDGAAGVEYTVTQGNNVHAYLDTDANNLPDAGSSPDGGASLVFDFPINLTQQPSTYQPASVTNLFYWNNIVHDVLYHYGFNEASGNFQENNYGNGGSGSDSVRAEAQDGGGTNNANFATPADGNNPTMQMFLWNLTSPMRDGDLDNGVIVHEYGHGASNRLTGGPSNVFCLGNTEQMGEGWSDYLTLIFTMETGDAGTERRGIGTYVLGEPTTGTGIRAYPYSTDMAIDPRTYDEIKTAAVPHGVGSTWAAMLWEMTWALIDEYGFDPDLYAGTGGNNLALQLVMDGMKLQPCSPGFVDGRDAILLADQNNNEGVNQCTIWSAFAKRGLGFSADQGNSNDRSDGTQAFDLPQECQQVLKIDKTASPSPVEAGSLLTYDLEVTNDTLGTLTGVIISDTVPANTTFVPGSATCGGSEAGGVVTFPLGTMASTDSQVCSFQVKVDSSLGSVTLFTDDMESGAGQWSVSHDSGTYDWYLSSANPHSPSISWFSLNPSVTADQYLEFASPVALSGTPVLRFWHYYNTEPNYDGGVVEISADGGPWTDLGPLMTQNGYNGTISTCCSNPIAGRNAFQGSSGGYMETVVDLSSYTGSNVSIRFRLGSDYTIGAEGWYVDDVQIINEASVTNKACVTAVEGDSHCDTVVTLVDPQVFRAYLPLVVGLNNP
jgi:extracellular elastinolytic metalloproteinase